MKRLRKLQLRQGQELNHTEQQHVVAAGWTTTKVILGTCHCRVPQHDAHIDIHEGYTSYTSWVKIASGIINGLAGLGEIINGYETAGRGYWGALVGSATMIVGGKHVYDAGKEVTAAINITYTGRRRIVHTLISRKPFSHSSGELEPW